MPSPRKRLREMLGGSGVVLVPEALSAGMARMAEMAGFHATYIGGHAMGLMHLGIPDHGLIYPCEMSEFARRICDVVEIPLICDADQGGETALNTYRTVRDFERSGAAAIHIEDTCNPKHLDKNNHLVPVKEMQARLKAAIDARHDPDFVIIARTDSAFNKRPIEETIMRGIAYAEAGADAIFVCRMSPEDLPVICDAIPVPVMDMNHPRSLCETTKLKVNLSAGMVLRGILTKTWEMLAELKETGKIDWEAREFLGVPGSSQGAMDQLVRDIDYLRIAQMWAEARSG